MACYHPLKAFQIGVNPSGKPKYKITSYDCDYIDHSVFGSTDSFICCHGSPSRTLHTVDVITDFIEIPCGQCLGCRLDYSRQWADRCMLELQEHESSYFLTLTYNDDHVPFSHTVDDSTGEITQDVMTLRKRDFQLFMKRLRKHFSNQKLRFFAAGEYGSESFRPHYHAIVFGLKLDDLVFYKRKGGYNYYTSPTLDRLWWSNGSNNGWVVVGKVTWETCAYTARYILKKQKGAMASVYDEFNIEPEFSLMSRKPGIARNFYEQNKKGILLRSYFNITTDDGGRKIYPPRYFNQLFDIEYPEESAKIREAKKLIAEKKKELKLENTSNSYLELLAIEERNKQAAIKKLTRSL